MNAVSLPSYGSPLGGGFFAGRILIASVAYALIVAPKAEGDFAPTEWIEDYKDVPGARSFNDGLANTAAMAVAGSELAKRARDLRIGGFEDWYVASQDETEICYRNLKPGTDENSLYMRSGINVSAIPPTYPYSLDFPKQTESELFRTGGSEAFEEVDYWTSTQHASLSYDAWSQLFADGTQDGWFKDNHYRARVVRRLAI